MSTEEPNVAPQANQPVAAQLSESDAIRKLGEAREKLMEQLSQIIVGQQQVVEELLISLFSRGHCLLEGVPGLAKTLRRLRVTLWLTVVVAAVTFWVGAGMNAPIVRG